MNPVVVEPFPVLAGGVEKVKEEGEGPVGNDGRCDAEDWVWYAVDKRRFV
jgi:hypothetical protein